MRQTQSEFLGGPLEHHCGVVRVENGVVACQPHQSGVAPEQTGGKAVKGAHFNRLWSDQLCHPPPHLVGGLVGEREGDDLAGGHSL